MPIYTNAHISACHWSIRVLLLLLLKGYAILGLFAQEVQFTAIDDLDLLWNQFITSGCQDEQGYLWLGTPGGVLRFDGYEVKRYGLTEEGESHLSDRVVWSVVSAEKDLWIATENGLNRFDMATETFEHFLHQPDNPRSLSHNQLETVFLVSNGDLWVGTHNGWSKMAAGTVDFERYFYSESEPKEARGIIEDRHGNIWLSVQDELYQYQVSTNEMIPHHFPEQEKVARDVTDLIRVMFEDSYGNIWLGTELNGLYQYDPHSKSITAHYAKECPAHFKLKHNRISALAEDEQQRLWVGTYGGGLHELSLETKELKASDFPNEEHIQPTVVRTIFMDQAGNLWFGTQFEGFWAILNNKPIFHNFKLVENGFTAPSYLAITEANNNEVWLSSTNELFLFKPSTNSFSKYRVYLEGNSDRTNIQLLHLAMDSRGRLWTTDDEQLFEMIPNGQAFSLSPVQLPVLQAGEWIREIVIDPEDNIWVATGLKIIKYSPQSGRINTYQLAIAEPEYGSNQIIRKFQLDPSGRIWISTKAGLNRYYPEQDSFLFIPHPSPIFSVGEDYDGNLIASTIGKSVKLDVATNQFIQVDSVDALSVGATTTFLDNRQHLWILYYAGLIRYHPPTQTTRYFNAADGLGYGAVSNGNWLQSSNGTIYLGGINWLSYFHPDDIPDNDYLPPLVLTDFQLYNRSQPIRGSTTDTTQTASPLLASISHTDTIQLNHRQNDIAITFAALDYTAPSRNSYRYRLIGYDSSWVNTEASKRTANFTNLSPGYYEFEVQAANNAGRWNPESRKLYLFISYPWYQRSWALMLWALLTVSLLWWLRRYEVRRQLARAEAHRLTELDSLKSKLYTNITHEFRTPLTLILGISQRLLPGTEQRIQTGLLNIQRNGEQLLQLVNQLLDLAKLEGGFLQLQKTQGEMVGFLQQRIKSFQPLAKQRGLMLELENDLEQLWCDADFDRLQQVIDNLLANAIKFTSAGGSVSLKLSTPAEQDPPLLSIIVSDDGPGISAEAIPHIFDRFYQADTSSTRQAEGTGIGLALCKELIQLMGGTISVESEYGLGSDFQLLLPITQEASFSLPSSMTTKQVELPRPAAPLANEDSPKDENLPRLLIVEDHPDLRQFLTESLTDNYHVNSLANGQEAWEYAREEVPDLVVSDVMMPLMDGFELCQHLKTDERTSHIPVILLTAKVDDTARLTGLRQGADAYLAKPFVLEELNIRIEQLLLLRQQLQTYYLETASQTSDTTSGNPHSDGSKMEHSFVIKAREVVLQHLDNPDFSATDLCAALHLSRTHLHRKITGLTGLSTNRFITFIRMEAAKRLLNDQELSVSEVAYQTGYRTPEYFARVFRQTQGKSPTNYRQQA